MEKSKKILAPRAKQSLALRAKKTYHLTQKEIKREWHLMDATNQPLGRMASKIASILMGKNKATYSPHMDGGDNVVVLNATQVKLTGRKMEQKVYRSHSGQPGGFKEVSVARMLSRTPERVIEKAVYGMLPDNRLRKNRMARLHVSANDRNKFSVKFKTNE